MAVYSMADYKRVFFSHTFRVNKVTNYFFLFRKVDFTQIEKVRIYLDSASKSLVCSKRTNNKPQNDAKDAIKDRFIKKWTNKFLQMLR